MSEPMTPRDVMARAMKAAALDEFVTRGLDWPAWTERYEPLADAALAALTEAGYVVIPADSLARLRAEVVALQDFKASAGIRIDEIRRLFRYLDDPEETGDYWAVFADLKAEIYADLGEQP